MTMNLIKHGTPRAGFKDWPTYDNKLGKEEPEIARCAVPDPDWVKEPPPRTYHTSRTQTGEQRATKIRDLRLRKSLTGTAVMPRLRQNTHPKNIGTSVEVDFEEELRKYKQDIKKDIEQYKKQEYVAPRWIKEALGHAEDAEEATRVATSSSISSWERPLTDSQAVEMSDYIFNDQEAQAYFSDDEEEDLEYFEQGPSWEHMWFQGRETHDYPWNLAPYGPEAYGAYWEQWLEEVIAPPPADYYYRNAAAICQRYKVQRRDQ